MNAVAPSAVVPVGGSDTPIWGMTTRERLGRIVCAQGLALAEAGEGIRVDLGYVFDPAWLKIAAARPGLAITREGVPVIAHGATIETMAQETSEIENVALRKRERPFMERLTPATAPAIERASYAGAYKGVTDVLTKYLWPEWAFHLTRLAARWRITPNGITLIGAIFCLIATVCFAYAYYWIGLAMRPVLHGAGYGRREARALHDHLIVVGQCVRSRDGPRPPSLLVVFLGDGAGLVRAAAGG